MSYKRLTDVDVANIRTMYDSGFTVDDIASSIGCCTKTVRRALNGAVQKKERVVEVVDHYMPEYKRKIEPSKLREMYEYKGHSFEIIYEPTGCKYDILPDEDIHNPIEDATLKDWISYHEDLIGILQFIDDQIHSYEESLKKYKK